MKLYVPKVGEKIILSEDWNCNIYSEHRNSSIFEAFGLKVKFSYSLTDATTISLTLPKNTILSFDRIYIRKGDSSDFDSITFRVISSPIESLNKARFWVKLEEANNINFEHYQEKEEIKKFKDYIRKIAKEKNIVNIHHLSFEEKEKLYLDIINSSKIITNFEIIFSANSIVDSFIEKHFRYSNQYNQNLNNLITFRDSLKNTKVKLKGRVTKCYDHWIHEFSVDKDILDQINLVVRKNAFYGVGESYEVDALKWTDFRNRLQNYALNVDSITVDDEHKLGDYAEFTRYINKVNK